MEIPFEKLGQQLTVLSFGVGQDSTAILVRLIEDSVFRRQYVSGELIVVFADTLNEHQHTYAYKSYIELICKTNEIPFYTLHPSEYATGKWKDGLIGFYKQNDAVGSKAFPKTCTDQLKIRPIYRFLEKYIHEKFNTQHYGRKKGFYEYHAKYGKIRVLLGIARDEESRASDEPTKIKWFDQCVEKVYPLLQHGMNRQDCQDTIKAYGYIVPMPSNCVLCPFMSLQELLFMFRYMNASFILWCELEENKMNKHRDKGDKNLGVWGTTKTLTEMAMVAIQKHGHMTKEELIEYKSSHGHCVKSKF